ncbi:MAG: biotin--[acetyl-CoA-carboxylase] ligase [Candidatus Omnitrophota bacterium]
MQNIDDKIISILKENKDTYVSGEELSRILGISRAGIWKHIRKIKEHKYGITASPHLGYRLTGIPDSMIPAEIKYKLDTSVIGNEIYSYQVLDSTNDTAEKLAIEGAKEGVVVFAENQQKGRGRQNRKWISPDKKGIYMSVILRPALPPSAVSKITLISSLAVLNAIRRISSLPVLIKWPNDIIINNKKVCGILTETTAQPDIVKFIIIGIGINVNTPKELLPENATSLFEESGKSINRISLTREILKELEKYYFLFKKDGIKTIINEWRDFSATLGNRVKINGLNNVYEGQALAIDEDTGNLIIREDSGFTRAVSSGDVEILKKEP